MNELVIATYIQIMQDVFVEYSSQEAAGTLLLNSIVLQDDANVDTDFDSKK